MNKCIVLYPIMLLVLLIKGGHADTIDDNDRMKADWPRIPPYQSVIPPPFYYSPVGDTVYADDVTTIFVTSNGRLFREQYNKAVENFPLFNKADYLSTYFYDTYLLNPEGYIRVVIHPHAPASMFIYFVEQMNIFENRLKEYYHRNATLSDTKSTHVGRQNKAVRDETGKILHRPNLGFELWEKNKDYGTANLDSLMSVGIVGALTNSKYTRMQLATVPQLPTALPSHSLDYKKAVRIYIPYPDSIEVTFTQVMCLSIDGQDTVITRHRKEQCSHYTLNMILYEGHFSCQRCSMLFYINQVVNIESIWSFLVYLRDIFLSTIYFGVIPRGSYPPGPFPGTMQAVAFNVEYCLAQPSIVR